MFCNETREHPYTYSCAYADLRRRQRKPGLVSSPACTALGCWGTMYPSGRMGDLTQVHGGGRHMSDMAGFTTWTWRCCSPDDGAQPQGR